jgi:hypothetical protein
VLRRRGPDHGGAALTLEELAERRRLALLSSRDARWRTQRLEIAPEDSRHSGHSVVGYQLSPLTTLAEALHRRGLLGGRAAHRLHRVMNLEHRPGHRWHNVLFEAWCICAFSAWTAGWCLQSEPVFALTFAVGFLPPSALIICTANTRMLWLLHREFNLWYICMNMLGFSVCMPFLSLAKPAMIYLQVAGSWHSCQCSALYSASPASTQRLVYSLPRIQIIGQVFSAWLFCVLDSVQITRRFKLIFGSWLLLFWGSLLRGIWEGEGVAADGWAGEASRRAANFVVQDHQGKQVVFNAASLGRTFLVSSMTFTALQMWRVLRHPCDTTCIHVTPFLTWRERERGVLRGSAVGHHDHGPAAAAAPVAASAAPAAAACAAGVAATAAAATVQPKPTTTAQEDLHLQVGQAQTQTRNRLVC